MLEIEGKKTVSVRIQDPSVTVGEMHVLDYVSLGCPGDDR